MDIVNKEISKEVSIDVDLVKSNVEITFNYQGQGAGASLKGYVSADYLLDKLAAKIPGVVDDAIFAVMKAAIAKL